MECSNAIVLESQEVEACGLSIRNETGDCLVVF